MQDAFDRSEDAGESVPEAEAVGGTIADDATHPATHPPPPAEIPVTDDPIVLPERYLIGKEIARGGLGRILRAHDLRLDRAVALKELHRDDKAATARFRREVRITAQLQHPNIVPLHEAGRWPTGQPFYAMKLVDGKTFARALGEAVDFKGRLTLLHVLVDVAEAMAYAHSLGIVHRDLKPANVLVGPFGETVVIDWGLAKHVDEPETPVTDDGETPTNAYETTVGVVVGTPAYMPPEQAAAGSIDRRADVYALGAMLYHLICGASPYAEHPSEDVLERVRMEPPRELSELAPEAPRDLVAIAEKAMARKPGARYPTAREMAEELRRYVNGGLVGAYEYGPFELLKRFIERHWAIVSTIVAAVISLLVVAGVYVERLAVEVDKKNAANAELKTSNAEKEKQNEALTVEKAFARLEKDPTDSIVLLRKPRATTPGAASITAQAEERGVAEQLLWGHRAHVVTVAYSPDGKFLATGGDDKRVVVWNLATGVATELPGHTDRVTKVVFSPSGDVVASASYDGTIRLQSADGSLVSVLKGHESAVKWVSFSNDGKKLCSIATDGEVRLWDRSTGASEVRGAPADRNVFCSFSPDGARLLSGSHQGTLHVEELPRGAERVLSGPHGIVRSAEFSPDGNTIAASGDDGTVRLWSLAGGVPEVLREEDSIVQIVLFSPDGSRLATGSMNGKVRLWDLSARTSRVVSEHTERVVALAFSADGRYLASSGWDKRVRVRDLETLAGRTLLGHSDVVAALAFSPDNAHLASGSWDDSVRIWNLKDTHQGRLLSGHTVGVHSVAFSPDGKLVASGGHDGAVRLFNVATGASRLFAGHTDHVFRVVFSPDGQWLASSSDDRTVRVWSIKDDRVLVLSGHKKDVEELAFSPDGTRLASGSKDGTARLWSLDGNPPVVLEHDYDVTDVAFNPKGDTLATTSRDRTIRLWDARTGALRRVLYGHLDEVRSVAFSTDGTRFASASADDSVIVWTKDGDRVQQFTGLSSAGTLAFSPDGTALAVAGTKLWLCELAKTECDELHVNSGTQNSLAFLPNGKGIVTGGTDDTVQVWDLVTHERRVLEGHTASVFDVAVSPDGRTIASGSADADVRLWQVAFPPRPQDLPELLHALFHEHRAPGIEATHLDDD